MSGNINPRPVRTWFSDIFIACLVVLSLATPLDISLGPFPNTRAIIPLLLGLLIVINLDHLTINLLRMEVSLPLVLSGAMLFLTALSGGLNVEVFDQNSVILFVCGLLSFITMSAVVRSRKHSTNLITLTSKIVAGAVLFFSIVSGLFFVSPGLGMMVSEKMAVEKTFEYLEYDYNRGRIFPLFNLDISLPLVVSQLDVFPLLVITTALFSSNYRSRILVGILGIVSLILLTRKKSLWSYLVITLLSLVTTMVFLPTNLARRITTDADNIRSRVRYSINAINVGLANPVYGIGVGNYESYAASTTLYSVSNETKVARINSFEHPHNSYALLIAELGVTGLALYLMLLGSFILKDINYLTTHNPRDITMVGLIVSSWMYMIGSGLDWYSHNLFVYFMTIRGIIQSSEATRR